MRHFTHPDAWPLSIASAYGIGQCPNDPSAAWDTFSKTEVRGALQKLQHGLCAYCERVLHSDSGLTSIDHIFPKATYPEKTFFYPNLALCCNDPQTCNFHKANKHFAGFIDPTQQRCETSFSYFRDGSIRPSSSAIRQDATETLKILNLNHPPLVSERREYLATLEQQIEDMQGQEEALEYFLNLEMEIESGAPYYSAKRHLLKR